MIHTPPLSLSRFSGLTSDDFIGVETSLEDVQADLLKLFFTDTILLGHSLESDLNSLKVHNKTEFIADFNFDKHPQ